MLIAYKTEIKPTQEQKAKINRTIGVCRFIYNFYITHNKEIYEKEKRFVSGMDFSKWLNNEFVPNSPDFHWIKEVSSKAVKKSIMNAETAFKRFFKQQSKFPRFKKKKNQDTQIYFPKNNKTDWIVERHRLKVPTVGWMRLKEKGYIPTKADVSSGTISCKAGRYFVSLLVKEQEKAKSTTKTNGIGIDLGLKTFAKVSNNKEFKNINKTQRIKKLEKKLRREQRRLSRKYENDKNKKRGEKSASYFANIKNQIESIQAIHFKLTNIRADYVNKVVNELVKTKPAYVTIEDLNVRGMMKNKNLAKAISKQKFYDFRMKLIAKAKTAGIEVRIVDRFFPSSKLCSCCNGVKSELKLSERTYVCEKCGLIIDRDLNAAINLADAKTYTVA